MHRRATIRAGGCVGPALPVLKYISTFRSGSRPSLPPARLVARQVKAKSVSVAIRETDAFFDCGGARAKIEPSMSKKLVFLSLVTGLAACGSGNKEMTVAEFTQKISENECASVADACLVKKPVCQSARQAYWSQVANQTMAAGWPFDPSHADSCLSKVKSVYGVLVNALVIQAKDYRQMEQTCSRVFHGPAKEAQACQVDLDCVDDLICDKGGCGKPSEVGPGKQCANIGEYCSLGYTCSPVGVTKQCVARATKGTPCSETQPCLENLTCSGGLCIDGLENGSECQQDEDCAEGFCEPFARKCATSVRFSDSGACKAFGGQNTLPSSPDASVD
jgi:hypothetical protein